MAKNFAQRMESDGYKGTEFRAQWDLPPDKSQLSELFRSATDLHAVATHNLHKYDNISQGETHEFYPFIQLQVGCHIPEDIGWCQEDSVG